MRARYVALSCRSKRTLTNRSQLIGQFRRQHGEIVREIERVLDQQRRSPQRVSSGLMHGATLFRSEGPQISRSREVRCRRSSPTLPRRSRRIESDAEVSREIGSRLCRAHVLDEHEEAKRGAAQRDEAERLPELKEGGERLHPCRPCFSVKASVRLPHIL